MRPTACGDPPSPVCDWVHDRTGNGVLASLADWFVGRPLKIVLIASVAWLLTHVTRRIVRRALQRVADSSIVRDPRRVARTRSISGAVGSSAAVLIWSVAVIMIVGQLGIDLAPLLAGAGIAGIAVGFGAQSLVRDCITGLFMIIEDQFGVGDVIDVGEPKGVVERMTLRTTVLRDDDGTVWHVPNGSVQRVGNRSQLWSMAMLDVAVPTAIDLPRAKAAVLAGAMSVAEQPDIAPLIISPPALLGVESVDAENVTLRITIKTSPGRQYEIQRSMREEIKQRIDRLLGEAAS